MSALLQNVIEVRGVSYTVQELTAKHMAKVQQLLDTEKWQVQSYVAQACCLDPKIDAVAAASLPHFVIDAIADEAFRLSKQDAPGNG